MLLNWLRKRLGYYVCEEFTQWRVVKITYQRLATPEEVAFNRVTTVQGVERVQERQCTICGKTERIDLG